MCVILFAYKANPQYPLILAANRDEFFHRPASPADFWKECPHVLAGKDLKKGGAWLGIAAGGYFAALTNYRDLRMPQNPKAVSRGGLSLNYLAGRPPVLSYLREVEESLDQYNNFNLLLGKFDDLFFYSSVNKAVIPVKPGARGLSNGLPDEPWPKVKKGKSKLRTLFKEEDRDILREKLADILRDSSSAPDDELPDTGLDMETERKLSPIFIKGKYYGTRVSTVLIIDRQNRAVFEETTFGHGGEEMRKTKYDFNILE